MVIYTKEPAIKAAAMDANLGAQLGFMFGGLEDKWGGKPNWRIVPKPVTRGKEVAPGRSGLVHVDT